MSDIRADASSRSRRIAVVGMGGIGSTFAFHFARVGGHEVTAIARPDSPRLRQLQRDGGVVNEAGERAALRVADVLDEAVAYDLVLVTLPAYQAEAVLPALQRSAAKRIQFMCNTFHPERLQTTVGAARCSFGMPFVQGSIDPAGVLHAKVGAGGRKTIMDDRESVRLFTEAGIPAVVEPDMPLWLRCHVPVCVAFESVSVAAMRRGKGASWAEARQIARGMREAFTLIRRLGYPLYPAGKSRLHAMPLVLTGSMLWFVSRIASFRELLATGANECRALTDELTADAMRAKPPVSVEAIAAMKPTEG